MNTKETSYIFLLLLLFVTITTTSQTLRSQVETNIEKLKTAIQQAETNNINVEKEKMTLRTAEVFLRYSDWDEVNITKNRIQFNLIQTYRNNKVDKEGRNLNSVVDYLPTLNREQIIAITNEAINTITEIRNGTLKRPKFRNINFENLKVKKTANAEIIVETVNGVDIPTLFYDYTFKPAYVLSDINDSSSSQLSLTEFHGNSPNLYLTADYLNQNGTLKGAFTWRLNSSIKNNNNISRVFLDHRTPPNYVRNLNTNTKNDTKSIYAGQRLFIKYDIDNPDTDSFLEKLLDKAIPEYKNSANSILGYMSANEPHWATIENDYFTPNTTGNQQTQCDNDPNCNNNLISYFTMIKFEEYLKNIYGNNTSGLNKLNTNWFGTNTSKYLTSFDDIKGDYIPNQAPKYAIDFPIKNNEVGTPKAYDWFKFNNQRVTEWFSSIHETIKKHDSDARTHIKLIPLFFSSRPTRDSGLDFEALQEIQEIIGNDADMNQELMSGRSEKWMDRYNFHWAEMAITFDFLSSVKPNVINFNSENHYVSTSQFRDLYLKPSYVRAAFWLGFILGENVSHIWYWPRETNGAIRTFSEGNDTGYAASLIHQPAVANEIGSVFYDMNAFGEEIYTIQNSRKPIRVFHSETSAINIHNHMEHTFEAYEKMFFDGTSVGFVTKNIIEKQSNNNWDVVVVYKTPNVTSAEINALQSYLDNGGTIILDNASLLKNEYGINHTTSLNTNKGGSIMNISNLNTIRTQSLQILKQKGSSPKVNVTENVGIDQRGCFWRSIEKSNNEYFVNIINTRKDNSTIDLSIDGFSKLKIENLLTGATMSSKITLKPNDVLVLKITEDTSLTKDEPSLDNSESVTLLENPVKNKELKLKFNQSFTEGRLQIFDVLGKTVKNLEFANRETLNTELNDLTHGVYTFEIKLDNLSVKKKIILK